MTGHARSTFGITLPSRQYRISLAMEGSVGVTSRPLALTILSLPIDRLQRVIAAFADAGIAEFATTRALEIIIQSNPKSRARARQRQNERDHICDLAQLIEDEAG